MLDGLVIIILVNGRVHRILRILHVLLGNKLFPDAHDFGEKASCLLYRILLSKKLTHVVITAAQVDTLWPMLLALEEYSLGQLLKSFLLCFRLILRKEKSSEKFINVSSILLNLLLANKSIV